MEIPTTRVEVLALPPGETLGLRFTPPANGVVPQGLRVDRVINPLFKDSVHVGDLLVAVAGQSVAGMGYASAVELLQQSPRPLDLSFEIDEARREPIQEETSETTVRDIVSNLTTYAVAFGEGPIGINLEDAEQHGTIGAVVRALKGQAKTSGVISKGDVVCRVNDTGVLCMPYKDVMEVFRTTPSPKTIEFIHKFQLADVQRLAQYPSASVREMLDATRTQRSREEENDAEDLKALQAIRRCMPVDIKSLSEADLMINKSPNGKTMSRAMARKFKRTNVLELLRMDPKHIMESHPSALEHVRVSGLTATERCALHVHLRDAGAAWKIASENDALAKRKFEWFTTLEEAYRLVVGAYTRHTAQYGPADNHPYATSEDPDIGCPLIGKQCPVKAAMEPAYDADLGFPEGDVYASAPMPEFIPACLIGESGCFPPSRFSKRLGLRSKLLKEHYKNVRLAAEANGACESIDNALVMLESRQRELFEIRLRHEQNKTESAATIASEQDVIKNLVSELRLELQKLVERAGVIIDPAEGTVTDKASSVDSRSSVECSLAVLLCKRSEDCLVGIEDRLRHLQLDGYELQPLPITFVRSLLTHLQERSAKTLSVLGDPKEPCTLREYKTRAELLEAAKETIRSERSAASMDPDEAAQLELAVDTMVAELLGSSGKSGASPSASALNVRPCEVADARSALAESAKAMRHEKRGGMTTKHLRWHARLVRLIKRLWRAVARRLKQQ